MSLLLEYEQEVDGEINKLENNLTLINKMAYIQQERQIKKCETLVQRIFISIESYEQEIISLNQSELAINNYKLRLEQFKQKLGMLNLNQIKNEGKIQENLFKGRNEEQKQYNQMTTQQLILMGDEKQQQAINTLIRIDGQIQESNQLANQINEELDKQIFQLDTMNDNVKDTQSILKKSSVILKQFAQQIYTDKLLMCLIGLIFTAIVVLIILSALGLDEGKFNTPDQIKGKYSYSSTANQS